MRIGEINKDNYESYLKLFGGKSSKALDSLMGKDKKAEDELTEEERIARLVKSGNHEEGMFIREGDESWKKTVPVSDEIKDRLISVVQRQFLTNANGMGTTRDGDEIGAIMKEYRANIPASERLSVTWTLGQIVSNEEARLIEYVKASDPSWDYAKPIDKNILADIASGSRVNIKV